jgi:hypothetical protein
MGKTRHDRLLGALIAKLPPGGTQWRRDDRIAWLWMMALAFDVVYGPCDGISIAAHQPSATETPRTAKVGRFSADAPARPVGPGAHANVCRFYVDRDGFAMADGRPIAMTDLPPDTILWDERTGIECGDIAAILWRDIGATRQGLPPGVILRPASDPA